MKKVSLLLLLSALFAFSSCKKENPTLQETLVGKWNITSFVDQDGYEAILNNANQTTTADISFTSDLKSTLNLNEVRTDNDGGLESYNGTFSWLNATEINVKYTFYEGNSDFENIELKGKPSITNDQLLINFERIEAGEVIKLVLKADRVE
jgi:hypothetical protein